MPTTRTEYALTEAAAIPSDLVNAIVQRVEALPAHPTEAQVLDIANCISQGHSGRSALQLLMKAWWEERAEISPASLCLALRAACNAAASVRESQRFELAWSGPELPNSLFRRTDRVSADVIDSAQRELWIATYSISRSELMIERLGKAKQRGVRIYLLIEHPQRLNGDMAPMEAYREIGLAPMTWRRDLRPAGGNAAFHPKCLVADAQVAFVTSANLSVAAHDRNIEAGVLITGGELPRQLALRFASLLTHDLLEPI
jgi:phosphatidylserine/phosphatidylglycerophosphate/cardiolipin synthase-like enzyme